MSSNNKLPIYRQCELLHISRSSYYYKPSSESSDNLQLMRMIDEEYLKYPFFGSRQMKRHLERLTSNKISRHRIRRLMRKMGLIAIYQAPKTSIKNSSHKIYPYLLRNLEINRPNQVWCSDITYIPLKKGFLYFVAIMDWYSRKILSWRLSNTMDVSFCTAALEEVLDKYGEPEIFNTDQGSQYTSFEFTNILKSKNIKISMDGKGRWVDNVFIERVWRSLKYECIYLQEFETGLEVKAAIENWVLFYNNTRPHSSFAGKTPGEVYNEFISENRKNLAA